jgi:starch-binding outer membrane protein SusE/F
MKIHSILLLSVLFLTLSCEKDETRALLNSNAAPPILIDPAANTKLAITQNNLNEEVKFSWSTTGYGVGTEVKYSVEIDSKCNSFDKPIVIGVTTANSFSITKDVLNSKLVQDFKLAPNQLSELQLRVVSVINDKYKQISAVVPITITPYSDRPMALLIGENLVTAPALFASGTSSFEGYKFLEKGTSFKFSDNTICAANVFGANGEPGKLSKATNSTKIDIVTSGYYKVNANTESLTYQTALITTWGLIGTSTAGGWNTSTPMTYNPAKDVWEKEASLNTGALKFRANDGWDINYGTVNINETAAALSFDAAAINIAEAGNYIVTLDFSQAKAPYKYTYSITKSSNIPEPKKLWLPGSYQGWNPSVAPTIYSVTDVLYEGHLYIPEGAGFKFTSAPDWGHINYGDSGTAGLLTTDGSKDGLSLNTGGYYRFIVNTSTLSYKIDLIKSMGLVGPATQGGSDAGWGTSVPMTYDNAKGVWTITYDLSPGPVKFRANNEWTINYGPADSNALQGTIIFDDQSAVNITEAGSYTVTLDFSRSVAPYKYTYAIKKN